MPGKILRRRALLRAVRKARSGGGKVALANGVFDLLHVGHVRYLTAARREADLLVVAINSDASARSLKGKGRPILSEGERSAILSALACVDFVTTFSEPTVRRLIEELRPEVHCKGTDYRRETVPERDAVRKAGGRIAIVGDRKNHASRDLLRTILERFTPSET